MRQLVSIRTIKEILPIEGADRIELAKVDGWQCVIQKSDGFAIGDPALYFEIDSVLPADDPRFAFLEPRKFRIKSMRLRGALSQGLLMPTSTLTTDEWGRFKGGETLQDVLGVQKYEVPVPISGEQAGAFPTHLVPKTDQERVQNIPDELTGKTWIGFEVTEKLDGTSCTILAYVNGNDPHGDEPPEMRIQVGVCSRNWEIKQDDDNIYARILAETDLVAKLRQLDRSVAIQGEIVGPRIQGNKYHLDKQAFYVFDIYDIDAQEYLGFWDRWELCKGLGLTHVPVINEEIVDRIADGNVHELAEIELTLEDTLALADGKSALFDTPREGLVFKSGDGKFTFKAISNKFLLKHE